MKQDSETLALVPFKFDQILQEVPELRKFGYRIDSVSFDPPVDSSEADTGFWIKLATIIRNSYSDYDGFVVLHGTDTMSYSASALSFMLENLTKPVIFTGSQLPIGILRTDGKENLISSIEVAAATDSEGKAMVPEVCIYFENRLYRGNRTIKYSAENFSAFRSANYPPLAEAGVHMKYNTSAVRKPENGKEFKIHTNLDTGVAILKIFPGITSQVIKSFMGTKGIRAVILETYGSGNAPTAGWFIDIIEETVKRGIIVINVTQCQTGKVDMEAYSTGILLKKAGVISGHDSTTEAALAKLFFLLGLGYDNQTVKRLFEVDLRGEITND